MQPPAAVSLHQSRPAGWWGRLWQRGGTPGDRGLFPRTFIAVAAAAIVIQAVAAWTPELSAALIYDRPAIGAGQWWRLWTGHLVHYGWLHGGVDAAVLLCLGRIVTWPSALHRGAALLVLPPLISAALWFFDRSMTYYAGLSALNLGLFVFHALHHWQRNRTDWLWPAVLVVCLAELTFESLRGGSGGGLIAFSDLSVRIATTAHIAGGLGGLTVWLWCRCGAMRRGTAA